MRKMEMIANLRSFDVKQILVVNEKNLKNISTDVRALIKINGWLGYPVRSHHG